MGFHVYMISYVVTNINDRSSVGYLPLSRASREGIRAGQVKIRMA
jgi:hypothetical protein